MEKLHYQKYDIILKIDPNAILEYYFDSDNKSKAHWDITTKEEFIEPIKTALGTFVDYMKDHLKFFTPFQSLSECVTCNMALASVGKQCRFCAGVL